MINNNIFLIGMMGSGKSTIAPELAKILNINFIDIDNELLSILDTNFSELNEKKFRTLESKFFLERIKNGHNIYATGGGVILKKENRYALKNMGISILLDTSIENLFQRLYTLDFKNRPLLNHNNLKSSLNQIWNDRKKMYYECAHFRIDTNGKNIDEIIQEIKIRIQ